jgi:hypothetical protein
MPQCSYCYCDLPGDETLCSKCFEARYSKLGHPTSLLQSIRQWVSNPLGLTPESERTIRLPAAVFFCFGGILLCWYGGFARVGYRHSLFSEEVVSGALLILVKSAGLSLGLALFMARKNLKLYWEAALVLFLGISLCYARWSWHVGVFPIELRSIGAH